MQIADYARVVQLVAEKFNCVDSRVGFGVFGEAYGGHMVLNLVAGEDEAGSVFSCGVAVKPIAAWQPYVYPFTTKVRLLISILFFFKYILSLLPNVNLTLYSWKSIMNLL